MSKPAEESPVVLALAFAYQLGRQHEAGQVALKAELGKQLAKAFDDGFVLGRETGLKDAEANDPSRPARDLLS